MKKVLETKNVKGLFKRTLVKKVCLFSMMLVQR